MKKNYILVAAVAFFVSACGSSSNKGASTQDDNITQDSPFQCDGRTTCSQMDSAEEAQYFLKNCPNVKEKIDSDDDGIACERKFPR